MRWRPALRIETRPAPRSTGRCWDTAERVISNVSASSKTGISRWDSRARMAPRVGAAMEAKTSLLLGVFTYLRYHLNGNVVKGSYSIYGLGLGVRGFPEPPSLPSPSPPQIICAGGGA